MITMEPNTFVWNTIVKDRKERVFVKCQLPIHERSTKKFQVITFIQNDQHLRCCVNFEEAKGDGVNGNKERWTSCE